MKLSLSFGKKKSESSEPVKKKAAGGGSGVGSFLAVSFVAVVLVVYGCIGALFFLQMQQRQAAALNQVQTGAEALAARLSDRVGQLRVLLARVSDDPRLAKLLVSGDPDGLRAEEKAIGRILPGAWRVRLLPKGWNEKDTGRRPHMGFASLDILRAAERSGKVTPAEVHQFGSEHQHIALAAPVFLPGKDREVAGVIHAAFKMNQIRAAMDGISDYGGRVEVRQVSGDKALMLAENPGAGAADGPQGGARPVAGTIWEVAYWPSPAMPGQMELLTFWGVPTAGLALIGLVMFLQSRRLKQALKRDQGVILQMVEEGFKGGTVNNPGARIADLGNTLELLARLGTNAVRGRRAAPGGGQAPAREGGAPDGPSTGPGGDDLVVADLDEAAPAGPEPGPAPLMSGGGGMALPDSIFRAYDIRGVVGETLTRDMIYELGRAIGSEAYDQGQQTVIVARDGRISSEGLSAALCQGLQDSGRDVLDLGLVPVPVLYFATHFLGGNSGVMLTASHNPPEYNGLKIVINGDALSGEALLNLRQRVESGDLLQGEGSRQEQDLIPDYLGRICGDVQPARRMKVVVDCGNGAAGVIAPRLIQELGCEVVELFCEVDGDFPNHHPDPGRPENLEALIGQVQSQQADLGVAFDGDGDRLTVVDSNGKIIWSDRLLMLFAADVLSRQPGGDILYDVKSSRSLAGHILANGGRPLMWKTGHSLMKAKLKETGALLAGEMSGHIYFKERWYGFDDALYACARLLEILSLDPRASAEVFAELPENVSTPELLMETAEGAHHELVRKVIGQAQFGDDAKLITIDGLRVEFEDGWGLVRASNTVPAVTFRFEAGTKEALAAVQNRFRQLLTKIDPQLKLPF
ncbi:MAG TPA: phosphomannomutase/phosphoglucomutase [Sedimenticola sp.]|nr:phosphomannomutase/phosphoglucomutase [Sedimenticola sp.]